MPPGAVAGTTLRGSWQGNDFSMTCPEHVEPGQRFVVVLSDAKNGMEAELDPDVAVVTYLLLTSTPIVSLHTTRYPFIPCVVCVPNMRKNDFLCFLKNVCVCVCVCVC